MRKLVGLAVVAFLLYQGYKTGLPWIQDRLEIGRLGSTPVGEHGESMLCVELAEQANATFGDMVRQFSNPPIDQQAWTLAFISINGDIGSAQSACGCSSEACNTAALAVSRLRDLALSFDGIARGNARGIGNPASQQARIDELLGDARSQAGG